MSAPTWAEIARLEDAVVARRADYDATAERADQAKKALVDANRAHSAADVALAAAIKSIDDAVAVRRRAMLLGEAKP